MLVQKSTIGDSGVWAGTAEYYRSTREAVLVKKSIIGALGRLRWYSRVLLAGTLGRQSNIGALGRLC